MNHKIKTKKRYNACNRPVYLRLSVAVSFVLLINGYLFSDDMSMNEKLMLHVKEGIVMSPPLNVTQNEEDTHAKREATLSFVEDREWSEMPKLRFDFMRSDDDGNLVPVKLYGIGITRDIPEEMKIGSSRRYEQNGVYFLGSQAGNRGGAYGALIGIAMEGYLGDGQNLLVAGQRYRIWVLDGGKESYFVVPESPKASATYHVTWLIDEGRAPVPIQQRSGYILTGKILGEYPHDLISPRVVYQSKSGRYQEEADVKSDGEFSIVVPELGGMLIVGGYDGTPAWMYKGAVVSTNSIIMPADADFVMDRKSFKKCVFAIEVDESEMQHELGFGLYVKKADVMPVFYKALLSKPNVKRQGESRYLLHADISAGNYWVKVLGGNKGETILEQEIRINHDAEKNVFELNCAAHGAK